jgi:hypothetical protein
MDEALRKNVLEIGELVKQLPENVQEKAFEMLLARELGGDAAKKGGGSKEPEEAPDSNPEQAIKTAGADDLQLKDLPIKARKFLEKQGLSIDHINQLFYRENAELKTLYEDLKTTKTSESQIRLGLLAALKNGLEIGEFEFNGEPVRQQCQIRKCYDAANFTSNFKNNAKLFENFSSYEKNSPIRLSEDGRKQLASLIKELQ